MTKITNFPQALDSELNLPNIGKDDRMNDPIIEHDVQHTTLNQAVIELQKKVGVDDSADENSIDYRLRDIEENGSGGQGLEPLDDESQIFVDLDETQTIPEHPSKWFMVMFEGEKYAVPAFKVIKPPEPPEDFTSTASAIIYYPKAFESQDEYEGTFNPPIPVFWPKDFTATEEWEGDFDGEDIN